MSPEKFPERFECCALFAAGSEVYVVLHKDPYRERIVVRASRVLDREGDVLFLAQTDPPVPEDMRGAEIEIAALPPGAARPRRPVGYAARLLDLRAAFPLGVEALAGTSIPTAPALAVSAPAPGDLFETSLRMHYRVPVEPGMNVVLQLGRFRVTVLDFSAGGAQARVFPPEPPAPPTWPAPPLSEGEAREAEEPDRELAEPASPPPRSFVPECDRDPLKLQVGASLPFRLLFPGSGYAAGDAEVRSARPAGDGVSAILGLCFTNMEIRDIRYLERMVARTVTANRRRERDADYE